MRVQAAQKAQLLQLDRDRGRRWLRRPATQPMQSGESKKWVYHYVIPVCGPSNAPEFHDDDQVAITVSNRGGAPLTVTNYGVAMGGKRSKNNLFVMDRPIWATKLPATVEPGGEPAQVLVPAAELRRAHQVHGIPFRNMRPWVDLGDGRRVYSKKAVPLR